MSSADRRDQIRMSEAEQLALLESERIAIVSTIGPRGWPHSMPLWFIVRRGEVWVWTYAKSQKVRNLERDPRATILVEAGRTYHELRGVQIEAEAELIRDPDRILEFGARQRARYDQGAGLAADEEDAALHAQAAKRVAIRFEPMRIASWDHRKLERS